MSRVSLSGVNEIIADTISIQEGNNIVNVTNKFLSKLDADLKFDTKSDRLTTYTKTETNAEIAKIVGGAPELLNTLNELSQAINDDQNFSTTILDELSLKATNIRVDGIEDDLQESIINNDVKLLLKENITDNDAKLLLKENITDNNAKLILKESITTNDAKLLLKENITDNDAKLLLKESIINNDAKLILKESIIDNDAKLLPPPPCLGKGPT